SSSRAAETEESTPPDMPTMTRVSAGGLACVFMSADQIQWVTRPVQIVQDALQHQGAAQSWFAGADFLEGQPVGCEHAVIQRQFGPMLQGVGRDTGALIGFAIVAPEQIDAGNAGEFDGPGGLFKGFAQSSLH